MNVYFRRRKPDFLMKEEKRMIWKAVKMEDEEMASSPAVLI